MQSTKMMKNNSNGFVSDKIFMKLKICRNILGLDKRIPMLNILFSYKHIQDARKRCKLKKIAKYFSPNYNFIFKKSLISQENKKVTF